MRLFNRFALAGIAAAITLSGCTANQPVLSSNAGMPEMTSICGHPAYKDGEDYEIHVNGVCAKVNEHMDPTTPRNQEVFQYVISDERQQLLYAAYKPFVHKLLNRMLSGEIPYELNSGDVKLLPKSGDVIKDEEGDYTYEPLPYNGWGMMVATMKTESGSERESIRLKVKITNGQLDQSVEPLWFDLYTRHGDLHFFGPLTLNRDGAVLPHMADSLKYFMNMWDESNKPNVSLIDYVTPYGEPSPAYQRQLGPDDRDLTVLASTDLDPATRFVPGTDTYRIDATVEDIKLNDARFLEILAGVDKDGSYWYE